MATKITLAGRMRACVRIAGLILVLVWYLGGLLIRSRMFGEDERRGFRYRRKFTGAAMKVLGVTLLKSGDAIDHPALYVGNHRSLLDPIIQLHFIDAYVVAKSEVSGYPLIGKGARATGVVFVKRESMTSRMATRDAIRDLLLQGKSVLIYPEGTTSNVEYTQEFKSGSFEIAAELRVPVVPVAIDYANPANYWHGVPMLTFFMQKFARRRIITSLSIGESICDSNAEQLLQRTRASINQAIARSREAFRRSGME